MTKSTDILTQSLTPIGTRELEYREMLQVLTDGAAAGLVLFAVDVTNVGQVRPLPQWMFRLTDEELQTVTVDQIVPMALEFYRKHGTDPELTNARFQVFFDEPA